MNDFKDIMAAGCRQTSMTCSTKAARKLIFDNADEEETRSPVQDTTSMAWRDTNQDMDCFDADLTKSTYDFSDCSDESLPWDRQAWDDTPRRYVVEAEVTESVSVTITARRYARLELEADDFGQISCRESSGSTNISASNISPRQDREMTQNFQSLASVMDGLNIDNVCSVDSDVNLKASSCLEGRPKSESGFIHGRLYGSSLNVEQCNVLTSHLSSQSNQTHASGHTIEQIQTTASSQNVEQSVLVGVDSQRCQANASGLIFEQYQTKASTFNGEQCHVLFGGDSQRCQVDASGVYLEQFQSGASCIDSEKHQTEGMKASSCSSGTDFEEKQTSNCVTSLASNFNPLDFSNGFSSDLKFATYRTCNMESRGTLYLMNQSLEQGNHVSNFQNCPPTNTNIPILSSNPFQDDTSINHCQTPDYAYELNTINSSNVTSPVFQRQTSSNYLLDRSGPEEQSASESPQTHSRRSESMKCINATRDPRTKINFRTSSSQESCLSVEKSSKSDSSETCLVEKEELERIKYMLRNCELFHPLDMAPKMPGPTPVHSPVRSLMDGGDAVDVRGLANRLSRMKSEGRMRYALKQYVNSHIPSMQGKMDDIIESTIQQIANVSLGGEVSRPTGETTLAAIMTSEAWLKLGNCRDDDEKYNVGTFSKYSTSNGKSVNDVIVELHENNLDYHPHENEREPQKCTTDSRTISEFTRVISRKTSEVCAKEKGCEAISTTEQKITSCTERKRKRKIREVTGESTRKGKKRVSFAFTEDEGSDVTRCKRAYLD